MDTGAPDDVAWIDCETIPFRERLDRAVHGFQKIVAVRLDLEANEVAPSKPSTSSRCHGRCQRLPIRPRNVQKIATRVGRASLTIREAAEVIILRERIGDSAPSISANSVRETAIDFWY